MNSINTLAIVTVVVLTLIFAASRRKDPEMAALLQSNAKTIETLEQKLTDIQQTVGSQSQLINQLRVEAIGQAIATPGPATLDSEELWVTLEPLVEQHLEDREQRKRDANRQRKEEAMAKSREHRNQQLAEQLGLNPFQSEHLAKLRAEIQDKRREAMMPEEGEPFDPKRLPGILEQLEEEEQLRLAGFLTADQIEQYKKRTSQSVQFMSFGSDNEGSSPLSGAMNFSIQLPAGAVGASAIRTLTVLGDVEGDGASAAVFIEESDFFTEGEEPGEIILDNGEPLPFPPLPLPPPEE
jgi:anti-sigma28 factor (negative regulator of flagellin synthesis)